MDIASKPMRGKICLVTGATSGIGKESAAALAGMGAQVVVAARNRQKAKKTVQEIREKTGNQQVDYLLADLSSQEEVRQLASHIRHGVELFDRICLGALNYQASWRAQRCT